MAYAGAWRATRSHSLLREHSPDLGASVTCRGIKCISLSLPWTSCLTLSTGPWMHCPPRRHHSTCCLELRFLNCMAHLIASLAISDCACPSYNSNFNTIPGESAFAAYKYLRTCFVWSGSACQSQCGVNTFCTGDWVDPSSLTCACVDGYISPSSNGKACEGFEVCCDRKAKWIICLLLFKCRSDYDNYDHDYYSCLGSPWLDPRPQDQVLLCCLR